MPSPNRSLALVGLLYPPLLLASPLVDVPGLSVEVAAEVPYFAARAHDFHLEGDGTLWTFSADGRDLRCTRPDGVQDAWFLEGDREHRVAAGYAFAPALSGPGVHLLWVDQVFEGTEVPYILERLRCGEPVEVLRQYAEVPAWVPPTNTGLLQFPFALRGVEDAGGAFCGMGAREVVCFHPTGEVEIRLSFEDFRRQLVDGIEAMPAGVTADFSLSEARLHLPSGSSDGPVVAVAVAVWRPTAQADPTPRRGGALWVVTLDTQGRLVPLYGPELVPVDNDLGIPTGNSLHDARGWGLTRRLPGLLDLFQTEDGRIWLWPVRGRRMVTPWEAVGERSGVGLGVLSLDGPGVGHLELGRAINGLQPEPQGTALGGSGWRMAGFRGEPALLLPKQGTPPGGEVFQIAPVVIDPDASDLDADGLSAAEERRLGTSDLLKDSDGALLPDGFEYAIYGSAPADAADDDIGVTQRRAPAGRTHRISTEIRSIPGAADLIELAYQPWPSGWLCGRGICLQRDGTAVRIPDAGTLAANEAGTHAVGFDRLGQAVGRWSLPGGIHEPLGTLAELDGLLRGGGAQAVVPGRGNEVFLVGSQAVIALAPTRVLFDREAAVCEAEWGTCYAGPPPLLGDLFQPGVGGLHFLGYDPRLDRVLVGLAGYGERWVLAVGQHDSAVLQRSDDLPPMIVDDGSGRFPVGALLPIELLPLADGDFYGVVGLAAYPWSSAPQGSAYFDGRLQPYDTPALALPAGIRARAFGDSLFGIGSVDFNDIQSGVFEVIREGPPARPDPGPIGGRPVDAGLPGDGGSAADAGAPTAGRRSDDGCQTSGRGPSPLALFLVFAWWGRRQGRA